MTKKQVLGLAAAAVIFVFVSASSVLTNIAGNSLKKTSEIKFTTSEISLPMQPYIAVVTVDGTILDNKTNSVFSNEYNHKKTLKLIDDLKKSQNNKGILLYVNSPGGGVYESDQLYLRLKSYANETKRPIRVFMGSQAASGGYYISMAGDKIFADRNCWTGSIGVILSTSNLKGLYDKIGVKTVLFTSGANKAMGNPGIDMSDEQKQIFQSMVDESYEQFVSIVADGRGMDIDTVKKLADGRVYTAKQAMDDKLIDGISTYEKVANDFSAELGNVTIFTPKFNRFEFSNLFSTALKLRPQSDMEVLRDFVNNQESGVPMYYAGTTK